MKIEHICLETAEKLKNPHTIAQVAARDENVFMDGICPWDPLSLDYGLPGLIVFFLEMDAHFPGSGWKSVYRQLMSQLIAHTQKCADTDLSLFSGLTGICFASQLAAERDSQFAPFHEALHFQWMQSVEVNFLEVMERREMWGKAPFFLELDGMSGLPCFVFYLLAHRHQPDSRELLRRILRQIVRYTANSFVTDQCFPGWFVNPRDPDVKKSLPPFILSEFPDGFFEPGLAHGIAGSLAALAKALSCQVEVPGHRQAVRTLIDWLHDAKRPEETLGYIWPRRLGLNDTTARVEDYFDGWAHGAPGILNTLLLAAHALKDQRLMESCERGIADMIHRIHQHQTTTNLPFCFGLSGVLAILCQARSPFAKDLSDLIIAQYQTDAPFGFRCQAPSQDMNEAHLIDNPGLLTGSMGIILSLLMCLSKESPRWISAFLLG